MSVWLALLFGIVQGATEFLPVSSSGHLVLLNKIFGISEDFLGFSILLHIATLFAVFIVLWKPIWNLLKHPFSKKALMLYLSTLLTLVVVFAFKEFFESSFGGELLPVCFMLTALLLVLTEYFAKKRSSPFGFKNSVWVGLAQGIAVLPGLSRSGTTICAAVLSGANKEESAEFSFILSIPVILGSMLFEILEACRSGTPLFDVGVAPAIISFFSAFIVGLLSVKFMLKVVKKAKFLPFAIYLVLLSFVCLIFI